MLNFKKKKEEKKFFVAYKDLPPARVVTAEKRGKNMYLYIVWENHSFQPKWVKAELCKEYLPVGKRSSFNPFGRAELNWFEKLIVKLQNWWYGRKD